ncbi:MAG: sugar ABC transporter permease [Candidatus Eremiobacteraeota bacterium]|nr:sugar ABC transporter permease [Candidatus Eremiobacteraeota bacterium]MCW5870583.1 sugar ABC transporter permease [Candidatus Eremiobacteraeota bacterium]
MVSPAVLGLLLFVLAPFALSFLISFTDLSLGSPHPMHWVGTLQYERLFHDPALARALANNLRFALVVVPLQTALALALAVLLHRPGWRLAGLYRAIFFAPVVFPMSLVAVIWRYLYAPGLQGPANRLLSWLSLGHWQARDFLHDPEWALGALMALSVWQGVGLQMVILLGGLQQIPSDLYEAAALDGAGPLQRFRRVTLPMLRNTLIFTALMTSILAFRVFDQVQILTHGGPAGATSTLMFELVRSAFERLQMGRACALTVLFVLIVLLLTGLQRLALRQRAL